MADVKKSVGAGYRGMSSGSTFGGRRFANKAVLFRSNPINGAYEGTVTITRDIELNASSDQFTANDIAVDYLLAG